MPQSDVKWVTAPAFWDNMLSQNRLVDFNRPAILRFVSDNFMEEFMGVLEKDPAKIKDLEARYETWRGTAATPRITDLLRPRKQLSKKARQFRRLRRLFRPSTDDPPEPDTGADSSEQPPTDQKDLKLYQPAHQRYYLVVASLVCQQTGFPDRRIDTANAERASFVIRRKCPPVEPGPDDPPPIYDSSTWQEYAFISAPTARGWQAMEQAGQENAQTLVPGEEKLPMFAVNFTADDEHPRRLLAGLIPVGRREEYQIAGEYFPEPSPSIPEDSADATTEPTTPDPRMDLFRKTVSAPWRSLIEQVVRYNSSVDSDPSLPEPLDSPPSDSDSKAKQALRERIQTASWFIQLEMAQFLGTYLPNVWDAISHGTRSALTDPDEIYLYDMIESVQPSTDLINVLKDTSPIYSGDSIKTNLAEALKSIVDVEQILEAAETEYNRNRPDDDNPARPDPTWPDFLFPFADPDEAAPLSDDGLALLEETVESVLKKTSSDDKPIPTSSIANQPLLESRDGLYVIRTIFERPDCGPLNPAIVSEESRSFRLAGFFDPDAPARPIRIGLPLDVSPGGLRKFDKNTAFIMSDMLCGQVKRLKSMTFGDLVRSVLPWPFHKGLSDAGGEPCKDSRGLDIGMICSLSIPIITICALILLMIIVNLLDIIFRWIPYFILCFPILGLKGKQK
jgi:hypothetical protein